MSASASASKSQSQSSQNSTQGASGSLSPTLTSGTGDVTFNDQSGVVAQESLSTVAQLVGQALDNSAAVNQGALTGLSNLQAQQVTSGQAAQTQQQNELGQLLSAQALTASTQGTGGLNLTSKTYNYLIFGAVAVGLLAVWAMFSRK